MGEEEIIALRTAKLERLRSRGIDPYPARLRPSHPAPPGPVFPTKTGEPTVQVSELTLIAKALRAPPEKWHGLQDIEVRYRQRYLDLVANQEVREGVVTRSRVISALRRFLDGR